MEEPPKGLLEELLELLKEHLLKEGLKAARREPRLWPPAPRAVWACPPPEGGLERDHGL